MTATERTAAEAVDAAGADANGGQTDLRHRLYHGETAYDFYGKRWWGIGLSLLLVVITVVSLFGRGLNLGLDFVGGVAWEVPAEELSIDDARQVLTDNGVDGANARVQELTTDNTRRLKLEVKEQTEAVREAVRDDLAAASGVEGNDVDVRAVSARWGETVTESAIRALVVFLVLIVLFITFRFQFSMAVATIVAMIHDVLVSVGAYSVFGFEVTPATVIAFLTILGFSLYDSIVVFDKVRENRARYGTSHLSEADIDNISMNQVLMRSLNTGIAAVLPVIALLVVGDVILGAENLREFSLALLVGLVTGAYSSIFIATPLLAMMKTPGGWSPRTRSNHATGEELRRLVMGAAPGGKRSTARARRATMAPLAAPADDTGTATATTTGTNAIAKTTTRTVAGIGAGLNHPPRPRKKKRR
ncbi:MAG: protein translocase subunit SecF [Actinomycetota bacterium]|nr:protein translocase subunit SecF [Actinomycetota bacterium]